MKEAQRTPVLTVIIPSYNTGSTIEHAINSIKLAARELPVEVLVVDDGSSDNSTEILQKCVEAWSDVRVLMHPGHVNRGIAKTRNLAIREAKGKYLAFLDADDEMLPNRFDVCIPMLDADSTLDAVAEPYELAHVGGSRSEDMKIDGPAFTPISMADPIEAFQAAMQPGRLPHTTSITLRKSVLREVGGFPEFLRFNLEKPLWLKLYARGRVATGSEVPVARYFLHASSACATNEHKASFRFEDVLAYTDVYNWMVASNANIDMKAMVRAKIRGKYLHYCGYVNGLEHRLLQDRVFPFFHVASVIPAILWDFPFWKASLRMVFGVKGNKMGSQLN